MRRRLARDRPRRRHHQFYGGVGSVGLMCNGKLVGHAEAIFSPNLAVAATFDVPVLTPDFPH